jgi:hypothetical protein
MSDRPNRLVTRDELHEEINKAVAPVGLSTIEKLCMPSRGEGPPVAAWCPGRGRNRRPLYDLPVGLDWARRRFLIPASTI